MRRIGLGMRCVLRLPAMRAPHSGSPMRVSRRMRVGAACGDEGHGGVHASPDSDDAVCCEDAGSDQGQQFTHEWG